MTQTTGGVTTEQPAIKLVKPDAGEPEKPLQGWKPDDDQLALRLIEELKGKLAYFHSAWRMYDTGCWRYRDATELRRYLRTELRKIRLDGADLRVSQTRIKSLASMLEDDLFISDRALMEVQAEQRKYVNLRNGMFNLDTMEFEPRHDPELYFTSQLDFDYNEDATCPTFLDFLHSSLVHPDTHKPDASLKTLVLQALAYSMTARTDLKASFWLVGAKDSGKSTFINLLKNIMGSLHTTIDLNQLGINRFILAGIAGRRVVTFTEASSNTVLPDALYKAITGGVDELQADVKNRDPITFIPEAKIWWAMNEMPRVVDRSGATTRRIIIIPFNRTIPEKHRIHNLEDRLKAERSGIFNFMKWHYQQILYSGSFAECQQSEAMRLEYIQENDTEATFVEECCDVHESHRISSGELYQQYAWWCEARGFKSKNYNQVAGEWRRLGFTSVKSHGVMTWKGVRLREKIKLEK